MIGVTHMMMNSKNFEDLFSLLPSNYVYSHEIEIGCTDFEHSWSLGQLIKEHGSGTSYSYRHAN
jgi:hypothetical protein